MDQMKDKNPLVSEKTSPKTEGYYQKGLSADAKLAKLESSERDNIGIASPNEKTDDHQYKNVDSSTEHSRSVAVSQKGNPSEQLEFGGADSKLGSQPDAWNTTPPLRGKSIASDTHAHKRGVIFPKERKKGIPEYPYLTRQLAFPQCDPKQVVESSSRTHSTLDSRYSSQEHLHTSPNTSNSGPGHEIQGKSKHKGFQKDAEKSKARSGSPRPKYEMHQPSGFESAFCGTKTLHLKDEDAQSLDSTYEPFSEVLMVKPHLCFDGRIDISSYLQGKVVSGGGSSVVQSGENRQTNKGAEENHAQKATRTVSKNYDPDDEKILFDFSVSNRDTHKCQGNQNHRADSSRQLIKNSQAPSLQEKSDILDESDGRQTQGWFDFICGDKGFHVLDKNECTHSSSTERIFSVLPSQSHKNALLVSPASEDGPENIHPPNERYQSSPASQEQEERQAANASAELDKENGSRTGDIQQGQTVSSGTDNKNVVQNKQVGLADVRIRKTSEAYDDGNTGHETKVDGTATHTSITNDIREMFSDFPPSEKGLHLSQAEKKLVIDLLAHRHFPPEEGRSYIAYPARRGGSGNASTNERGQNAPESQEEEEEEETAVHAATANFDQENDASTGNVPRDQSGRDGNGRTNTNASRGNHAQEVPPCSQRRTSPGSFPLQPPQVDLQISSHYPSSEALDLAEDGPEAPDEASYWHQGTAVPTHSDTRSHEGSHRHEPSRERTAARTVPQLAHLFQNLGLPGPLHQQTEPRNNHTTGRARYRQHLSAWVLQETHTRPNIAQPGPHEHSGCTSRHRQGPGQNADNGRPCPLSRGPPPAPFPWAESLQHGNNVLQTTSDAILMATSCRHGVVIDGADGRSAHNASTSCQDEQMDMNVHVPQIQLITMRGARPTVAASGTFAHNTPSSPQDERFDMNIHGHQIQRTQFGRRGAAVLPRLPDQPPGDGYCRACFARRLFLDAPAVALRNCDHVVCGACALRARRCPICREIVQDIVVIRV